MKIDKDGDYTGHVWPVYKDEMGIWRILESTLAKQDGTGEWPEADQCVKPSALPRYRPQLCLNDQHVWLVASCDVDNVARSLSRHRKGR